MADQLKSPSYPWYEPTVGDVLEQGDFLDSCRIFIPRYTLADLARETPLTKQIENDALVHNVVIINQTCDMQSKAPLPYILVCPRWSYNEVMDKSPNFSSKTTFEEVRKGKQHRFCMLNKCDLPGLQCDVQIVDLAKAFIIPQDALKQFAQSKRERIRLRSPYKEKLAQAFGYYYMRVASPIDIEDFDTIKQAQISAKSAEVK
jgi:hypothetical protein